MENSDFFPTNAAAMTQYALFHFTVEEYIETARALSYSVAKIAMARNICALLYARAPVRLTSLPIEFDVEFVWFCFVLFGLVSMYFVLFIHTKKMLYYLLSQFSNKNGRTLCDTLNSNENRTENAFGIKIRLRMYFSIILNVDIDINTPNLMFATTSSCKCRAVNTSIKCRNNDKFRRVIM